MENRFSLAIDNVIRVIDEAAALSIDGTQDGTSFNLLFAKIEATSVISIDSSLLKKHAILVDEQLTDIF
ncbi:unnamed protein product [Leptosia nina]|uniref:Uncharacterized protein n=1 Tax=Leptosia nina TaxID=320188 RepID=A0AAV1K3P6_9NEOP